MVMPMIGSSARAKAGGPRVRAEGKLQIDGLSDPDKSYDWGGHVIVVDGVYRMWWTRFSTTPGEFDTIWHARSKDGMHWRDARKILVPAGSEHEKMHVADPSVVKVGPVYYLFYEANRRVTPQACESQIFLATSRDGVNWKKHPRNEDPLPIIALENEADGQYGIGMPSVHYRDGWFFMFYLTSFGGPDELRFAQTKDPRRWGRYKKHEVVAYGAAADVKYNHALGQYVMTYCVRSDLTPTPPTVTTCEVHVFTSKDGRVWDGHRRPSLWKIATDATCLTAGKDFHQPRTRAFATLSATDPYGGIHGPALRVIFMEGDMHPLPGDWKVTHPTWDLHALTFSWGPSTLPAP